MIRDEWVYAGVILLWLLAIVGCFALVMRFQ